ncbi:MAG TPA: nucleotidyltransferase domain-containing protein [Acetobacteraceae bacterium]|nr:nucleotidyltransferase domain-containing protein [Acetobacteraceae bacterium]
MDRQDIMTRLRDNEAALFGSRARGDAWPDSDTDIMIEIDPDAHIGVWGYTGLKEYIVELFDGPVDVVDWEALKPYIAPAATADAIYAFGSYRVDCWPLRWAEKRSAFRHRAPVGTWRGTTANAVARPCGGGMRCAFRPYPAFSDALPTSNAIRAMPFDPGAVRRWLGDIHHHIILAQKFAEGMSYDALHDDLCVTYAVTRCLEIVSEASRQLPDELKARHPSIQWRDMAGHGGGRQHLSPRIRGRNGARRMGHVKPSPATATHRD